MTKLLPLTLLCTLLCATVLSAQSSSNKFSLAAGIGITPVYHGKNATTEVPALSLQVSYEIGKNFSLGAYAGYASSTSEEKLFSDGIASKIENKTTALAVRGEYKNDVSDRLQVYGGFLLGYKGFQIKEIDSKSGLEVNREPNAPTPYNPNQPKGEMLYSGFIGTKYYFQDHLGLFGEVGYGLSLFTLGTTFKF